MRELEHPQRISEVSQPMHAEIDQRGVLRHRTPHQRFNALGHQHLARVRNRRESRGAVHGRAVVVAVPEFSLAGMQAHADTQRSSALGPRIAL